MNLKARPLFGSHGNDLVVAIALIWAAFFFAVSDTLQGTGYVDRLLPIFILAAGTSVLLVVAGLKKVRAESRR
ncbi:hypothetical protein [Natronomonas sp. EA1]|uniref:hypothetical protein n=1 Tax=Natronomonas sp. EA1 TaxID=3421655 RepID=UPI003EC0B59E